MPLAKAMTEDTLLVDGMNGQDLPPDHGAPVRALVPGWVGVANVKWVGRVEVSTEPHLFSSCSAPDSPPAVEDGERTGPT